MSWASAVKKKTSAPYVEPQIVHRTSVLPEAVDWGRLVTLDFETYYDAEYTLSKLSTSEYIRDPRFKAQMVGIKIGTGKTKVVPHARIKAELRKINWATHSLLCHNTQFDGLILSHHYNIIPARYYCTMSMARGLHSNEIGAGLDEVAKFYGDVDGKIQGVLETTKGVLNWSKEMVAATSVYCAKDVDLTFSIFSAMVPVFPAIEMQLVHMTVRMFCAPVLRVNIPRVEAEYKREVEHREKLMLTAVDQKVYYDDKTVLKTKAERELTGKERDMLITKRVIGSNERFAELLRGVGVEPPVKISPAWMKKNASERQAAIQELVDKGMDPNEAERELKWTYAFAKDDLNFVNLPDEDFDYWPDLDPNNPSDVLRLAARQEVIRQLVEVRLAVKSTTNITRAERFLKAGANGWRLPVGYAYARAHTLRWGGNNKMNMQNLTRGGELRLSIEAEKGHQIAVVDSGQIEARVNGWLWNQDDLLDAFRVADTWDKSKGVARGNNRDAYCRFSDLIYGREITTDDKLERFVGKVCVLGLGFQMGAAKFQITLAKGALGGPRVVFPLEQCYQIVQTYRRKNYRIAAGWEQCKEWIEHMADPGARPIHYKCLEIGYGYILLPNGLTLKYPDLKKAMGDKGWEEWSYQAGDIRKKIYGGLLCENLVQALARIIVAEQMVMIDKKYPVVMTTHDECVTHPKKAQAQKCFDYMMKCMTTAPAWCPDIPLAAEGGFADNYSK